MFSRRPPLRRVSAAVLGAAGFGALLAGSTGPAQAQFFDWFRPRPVVVEPSPAVPAPEIYRRLNGRGYQLNGNMQRNGGVYLADVVDSRGRQQRLVIDAYRGKILQSYVTAPPRPSASVPSGAFTMVPPPGTYASRDPMAPPPSTVFPGEPQPRMVPGFEARRPAHEPRQAEERRSKKRSKAATRETEPKAEPKAVRGRHHPSVSPAEATAPPAEREPTTASVPTSRPDTGSSVPAKAAIAPQAEPAPAPAPAATTASSAPVRAPAPAPAAPAANKPGYANGVPINPLD